MHLAQSLVVLATCALPLSAQSLVANLVTNTSGQFSSNVDRFVPLGGVALFAANGPFGREPWVTDGTTSGTFLLADLMPHGDSSPSEFVVLGNAVLFAATAPGLGRELWKSDGTTAGTVLVKDVFPGSSNGNPQGLVAFGGFVYFAATDGTAGIELWRSDGTTAGTTRVFDLRVGTASSSPMHLTVAAKRLSKVCVLSL